jgi:hypothetical protein
MLLERACHGGCCGRLWFEHTGKKKRKSLALPANISSC